MSNSSKHITLTLSDHFHNSVSSRAAIVNLFDIDMHDVASITVDFQDITFLSRSAAHQLLTTKSEFSEKHNIKVSFINLQKDIREMLETVESSLLQSNNKSSDVEIIHFSNESEFNKFLNEI